MREYAVIFPTGKVIRPLRKEEAMKYVNERVHVFRSVSDYDDIDKPIDFREVRCWDLVIDIDVKDEEERAEAKRVIETLNAVETVKVLYEVEPEIHFSGHKGYHVVVECFTGSDVNAGKTVRTLLAEVSDRPSGLGRDLAIVNLARLIALKRERKWYSGRAILKRKKYLKEAEEHDLSFGLFPHLDKRVLVDAHRLLRVVGSTHPETGRKVKEVEKKELIRKALELLFL